MSRAAPRSPDARTRPPAAPAGDQVRPPAGPPGNAASAAATPGPGLRTLLPYFRLLRGQERRLAGVLGLMAVSTAISLAIPLFAGRFVDGVTGAGGRLPWNLLAVLGGLLLLQLAGTYFYTVLSTRLGLSVITVLRGRLFAHLLEIPSLFFVGHRGGDLSSRMVSDVGSIQYLLTSGPVAVARAILTLVGAVALMLGLDVRLTLVILALVPGTVLLVQLFGRRLRILSRQMYEELGEVSDHVQAAVRAIRVIKVFNIQSHERERFGARLAGYEVAGNDRARLTAALESGSQILLWICLIAVVVYGFWLTARGRTTYGELVAFLLLAYRIAFPMGSLTSLYASAQGAVAAAVRLDEIFAVPPEGQRAAPAHVAGAGASGIEPPSPPPAGCRGELALEGVGFAYDGRPVLQDVSFRVPAGESVGIVGPSGAGKTTLASLIMGLFPPTGGRLLLDGRPYSEYDLRELRSRMAYVSQDPVIYPASVAENIRFGRQASLEAVREAARRAGALEFVEGLPQGFDTPCGESGARLSGGERQRLTLARAFLRDPRLLILDEPTSALDARAEQAIRSTLEELVEGRTALVVAHRLSLVRGMTRILVMAEGRIVEAGDHEQLMSLGGLYWSLHRLQHGSR